MQAQTQMAKGELLLEVQGRIVTRTVKEITPHGVRLQSNLEGQATGKYNASIINTMTMFLKTDGTNEWEAKAIHTTRDGDFIVVSGRGTGRMAGPGTGMSQGDVAFMTQSPKLSWLNNTKGWVESTADMAAGTFQAKLYAKK